MREVIGSYELDRVLGEGGMGLVYLAEHALLRRRAAIKVSRRALALVPGALQRFLDEARATSSIEEPGIVQIYDFGYHTDGRAYIVMEYIEGERLDRRLARTGRMPATEAMRITRQLATSLRAAHAHDVLHRDLKPENILLVTDPAISDGVRAKLLDFGICKVMHSEISLTSAGMIVGTPAYMSPEQCRGNRQLDARADVYALGCVLFFLVTSQPPFSYHSTAELLAAHLKEPAPRASTLNPFVPPALDRLIARCLNKLPEQRPASMAELAGELSSLLYGASDDSAAPVAVTGYVRGTPMNTTLAGSRAAASARPARPSPRRSPWRRRAVMLAFAALALSASATPAVAPSLTPAPATAAAAPVRCLPPAD